MSGERSNKRKRKLKATARTWKIVAVFTTIIAIMLGIMLVKTTAKGAHPSNTQQASQLQVETMNTAHTSASAEHTGSPLSGRRILVDPGHGDTDVGTIAPITGRYEKEINLEISLKLKQALQQKGADVVMTREDDEPIAAAGEQDILKRKEADMQKREEIIDGANADLFISIHQNRFDDAGVKGPQVFYLQLDDGQEYWADFAQAMQTALNKGLSVEKPRSINPGNWQLLRRGDQPCCIIECGFLSNPEEETLLQTDDYQNQVVSAIVDGLESYLAQ